MTTEFVELTSTDNQKLYVRKEQVAALELVTGSSRVEGHIKLYIGGFKFLIQGQIEELLLKLSEPGK
jgi:hypothetical protein